MTPARRTRRGAAGAPRRTGRTRPTCADARWRATSGHAATVRTCPCRRAQPPASPARARSASARRGPGPCRTPRRCARCPRAGSPTPPPGAPARDRRQERRELVPIGQRLGAVLRGCLEAAGGSEARARLRRGHPRHSRQGTIRSAHRPRCGGPGVPRARRRARSTRVQRSAWRADPSRPRRSSTTSMNACASPTSDGSTEQIAVSLAKPRGETSR